MGKKPASHISPNLTTNKAFGKHSLKEKLENLDRNADAFDKVFSSFKKSLFAHCIVNELSKAPKAPSWYEIALIFLHFQSLMFTLSLKLSISALHEGVGKPYDNI